MPNCSTFWLIDIIRKHNEYIFTMRFRTERFVLQLATILHVDLR